jgi:carboxyl-terminal processing protease
LFSKEVFVKRLNKKQLLDLGYFVAISLVWLAVGWFLRGWFTSSEFAMLQNIRSIVEQDFPDDVPDLETMSFAAARAVVGTLNDPYAVIIPPPASHKFDADFAGEAGNTGLVPNLQDGQMIVEFVLANSPAEKAGVQEGDILLTVDDVQITSATSLTEISLLLRGPVGTQAKLVVQRGDSQLTFTPVRQERVAVEWGILGDDVGYIVQHTFTTNAPDKFAEALTAVLATNPSAIIWDLRNNGGGSLLATEEILSFFIAEGLLFKAVLKDGEEELFTASGNSVAADIPLVLLVNEFTISAAEISAAVIAEQGRGLTIGTQTFGKGTIQNIAPIGNDHLLEYTIGRWITANNISYQGVGLSPHIQAPDDPHTAVDETILSALDQLR